MRPSSRRTRRLSRAISLLGLVALVLIGCHGLKLESPQLHKAAQSGDTAEVARLVNAGTPVDLEDSNGTTTIAWSLLRNDWRTAEFLFKHGADLAHVDRSGVSLKNYVSGNKAAIRWLGAHKRPGQIL